MQLGLKVPEEPQTPQQKCQCQARETAFPVADAGNPGDSQTVKAAVVKDGCLPEVECKSLLLKMQPISDRGLGRIELDLTQTPSPEDQLSQFQETLCDLSSKEGNQQSYLPAMPRNHNGQHSKIYLGVHQWHLCFGGNQNLSNWT